MGLEGAPRRSARSLRGTDPPCQGARAVARMPPFFHVFLCAVCSCTCLYPAAARSSMPAPAARPTRPRALRATRDQEMPPRRRQGEPRQCPPPPSQQLPVARRLRGLDGVPQSVYEYRRPPVATWSIDHQALPHRPPARRTSRPARRSRRFRILTPPPRGRMAGRSGRPRDPRARPTGRGEGAARA